MNSKKTIDNMNGLSPRVAIVKKYLKENLGNEEFSKLNFKNTSKSFIKRQGQEKK